MNANFGGDTTDSSERYTSLAIVLHWVFALLVTGMVLQPATGYLLSPLNKYGVKFFGLALPGRDWEGVKPRDLFMNFHHLISVLLVALIAIHVLAAFKHLLADRDRVFQRMLPGGAKEKKVVS